MSGKPRATPRGSVAKIQRIGARGTFFLALRTYDCLFRESRLHARYARSHIAPNFANRATPTMTTEVSSILLENQILLESGTNELEVLVFRVGDGVFGINVAKVREVLPVPKVTDLPLAHASIRGVFKLRNRVVPCVSLVDHLGLIPAETGSERLVILTDLNQQQTAFLVDDVERIHRLSWEKILGVSALDAMSKVPMTAVARVDGRTIVMLDFESILYQISDHTLAHERVDNPNHIDRGEMQLLIADDSPTVREVVVNALISNGYSKLQIFENGQKAWEYLEHQLRSKQDAAQLPDLIVTDVEMPQMDGLHLTKQIKENPRLREIPVVLYSSIVTPDNFKKGKAVGANAQISKTEINDLVGLVDRLLNESAQSRPAKTKVSGAGAVDGAAKPATPGNPHARYAATGSSSRRLSAPMGVEPRLWTTFNEELNANLQVLNDYVHRGTSGEGSATLVTDAMRTLHTIKGAAAVVPVKTISDTTHLMESLLEASRGKSDLWTMETLDLFLGWLDRLVESPASIDAILAESTKLDVQIKASIAAAKG